MGKQKPLSPITASIDFLFTLLIFWALLQWDHSTTIASKFLFVLLYLIIINDWFSCRATFEFYTSEMFVIDVIIIFLFLRMVTSLTISHLTLGYQSVFWMQLSFLSILYGIWDYVVSIYTEDIGRRKGLKSWGNKMFLEGGMCIASYFWIEWIQTRVESRSLVFLIPELPPVLIFVTLVIMWNKEKFQLYQELEKRFSKRKGSGEKNE